MLRRKIKLRGDRECVGGLGKDLSEERLNLEFLRDRTVWIQEAATLILKQVCPCRRREQGSG